MQVDLRADLPLLGGGEADRLLQPVQASTALRPRLGAQLRHHLAGLPDQAMYLVPLRIFIGLGWLRAATEKLVDPAWRNGTGLRTFLTEQGGSGRTLPFFEPGMALLDAFAVPIGVVVMTTEVLIGVAILLGAWTTPALLIAICLNLTFMLAGETNPSVFYILVELTLLVGGAGALLGVDGLTARFRRRTLLRRLAPERPTLIAIVALGVSGAVFLLPFAATVAPEDVIYDPALVTALLLLLAAGGAGLRLAREHLRTRAPGPSHGDGNR